MNGDRLNKALAFVASIPSTGFVIDNFYIPGECPRGCALGLMAKAEMWELGMTEQGLPAIRSTLGAGIDLGQRIVGMHAAMRVFNITHSQAMDLFTKRGISKYDKGNLHLSDKELWLNRMESLMHEYKIPKKELANEQKWISIKVK